MPYFSNFLSNPLHFTENLYNVFPFLGLLELTFKLGFKKSFNFSTHALSIVSNTSTPFVKHPSATIAPNQYCTLLLE